ncbi:SDR family NAD(P)-dependent oxidoreductase [Paenibacillus sp. MMS20-IR301]|uniref:SDR family NAD(P)-dependent oxidoreductase n=1 Tax=Paenibacillus sp. MMS20-IR301 TaxID=2895946 RepID=UPI0028E31E30|nr:SDR family NAD(P)-dependent oxidoreductase [Paenibacillus sp. MMS20-IR301]WNS41705.1 SDR family NAD(P)-dependent oxidoreductase [Paenibacillus sp. MMS20-IR301]
MTKVACVTGADRGLGLHLARSLLENKYRVFAGRYLADWGELDKLKAQYPDKLILIPLDIGNVESVKKAARSIAGSTGHIDLIINNAAIIHEADDATMLVDMDDEAMAQIYNVNTLGSLRVSNALMGLLLQGKQRLIVNISSEAGSIGQNKRINMYGYCMSKAALNMQSSLMHNHLRVMGGQVMVYHPGWLQSYMHGEKNLEAPIAPEDSAYKLMGIIQEHKKYQSEEPVYIDLDGNLWPW